MGDHNRPGARWNGASYPSRRSSVAVERRSGPPAALCIAPHPSDSRRSAALSPPKCASQEPRSSHCRCAYREAPPKRASSNTRSPACAGGRQDGNRSAAERKEDFDFDVIGAQLHVVPTTLSSHDHSEVGRVDIHRRPRQAPKIGVPTIAGDGVSWRRCPWMASW